MRDSHTTTRHAWAVRAAALVAAAALLLLSRTSQAQGDGPRYEATLGFGGAAASEKSIFNLPLDSKSSPEVLLDFRIRQRLNPNLALGLHFYGTAETTPEYSVTDNDGNSIGPIAFDLAILHLGVDVRYLFLEPPFQPYFELGVNYVSGSASASRIATLQMNGVSVGGGPGMLFSIGPRWGLGAQGLFAAGTARWDGTFRISSDRHYDPGFAGGEGFVFFRWGR